ncbi:MAG: hypothetical protein AAGD22_06030 [Verrucomicrobiota bacterium]
MPDLSFVSTANQTNTIMKALVLSLLITAAACFTVACSSTVGVGNDPLGDFTSVNVKTNDSALLGNTIVEVFRENGFTHASTGAISMTFRKLGTGTTDLVWGNNMNDNPTYIVATVNVIPKYGSNEYHVTCTPTIEQQNRSFGTSEKHPLLMGRIGYQGILDEIKKRVEKGQA